MMSEFIFVKTVYLGGVFTREVLHDTTQFQSRGYDEFRVKARAIDNTGIEAGVCYHGFLDDEFRVGNLYYLTCFGYQFAHEV
jgi:hypothetical protein